jgi:hypothetical protein
MRGAAFQLTIHWESIGGSFARRASLLSPARVRANSLVFALWQGTQRVAKLNNSLVPPRTTSTIWSASQRDLFGLKPSDRRRATESRLAKCLRTRRSLLVSQPQAAHTPLSRFLIRLLITRQSVNARYASTHFLLHQARRGGITSAPQNRQSGRPSASFRWGKSGPIMTRRLPINFFTPPESDPFASSFIPGDRTKLNRRQSRPGPSSTRPTDMIRLFHSFHARSMHAIRGLFQCRLQMEVWSQQSEVASSARLLRQPMLSGYFLRQFGPHQVI